jgi:hypothetical protein
MLPEVEAALVLRLLYLEAVFFNLLCLFSIIFLIVKVFLSTKAVIGTTKKCGPNSPSDASLFHR